MDTTTHDRRSNSTHRGLRWPVVAGCWSVWALVNASRLRLVIPNTDWPTVLWYSLPDAVSWALLTPIPIYLSRRFPITRTGWRGVFLPHLACAIGVAMIHTGFDAGLNYLAMGYSESTGSFWQLVLHLIRHSLYMNLAIYAMIVGVTHFADHSRRLHERDRQAVELRAQLTLARLDALQVQLRPHFLFNTLNTVSGLMERDVDTGRRVLRQLGDILRMSLENRDRPEVTLGEELDLVRAYLEIEQIRFGDRMHVQLDIPPGCLPLAVPVFSLQLLVENAITHGISHRLEGGQIKIAARIESTQLVIEITDNGTGGDPDESDRGQGVGLGNTSERLQQLYPDAHQLRVTRNLEHGWTVTMSIPARRMADSNSRSA